MHSWEVIAFSSPATSICSCSLSTTQGPAMRKKGLSRPTSNPQSFISSSRGGAADDLEARLRDAQAVLLERGLDERREERMSVARCRGELGVVLAAEEPRVVGELRHLRQVLGVGARADHEAGSLQPRDVMA